MRISRRKFAQILGATAAAAVARPALSSARATEPTSPARTESGIVRLSANENPYGPSPRGIEAMKNGFSIACRYPDRHADELVDALASLNGVPREQILLGDGSGEILKLAADVFTGPETAQRKPGGRLVVADPTFEAILYHAQRNGAEVIKVPLTADYGHDLPKMLAAVKGGLVYVCNPNNPTASITPKEEVRDFIARLPNDTMVLVDEAYYHYVDSPDYESVIPMVKDHPNLIVARTFSKIYGMAGLRCGYAVAQSYTIERLRERQSWDSLNIMAIVAAAASLKDSDQVTDGRRLNAEARAFTVGELEKMGYTTIPSQANFIMFDAKRPVVPLILTLKHRQIEVGRLFHPMPNHLRLTIGKKAEMEAFLRTFREITAPA
jgi:histidinol-phosphate aminotransferase